MEIRKLLESHKAIDKDIDLKLEEVAQLRALAERCTIRITGESRTACSCSDKVGVNAVKIADLERRIDAEIDKLVDIKEKILDLTAALTDENERVIIERHYILHESFEIISEKLGYSSRHLHRLHRLALQHLEALCSESVA